MKIKLSGLFGILEEIVTAAPIILHAVKPIAAAAKQSRTKPSRAPK